MGKKLNYLPMMNKTCHQNNRFVRMKKEENVEESLSYEQMKARLDELERLVRRLHGSRGRYHTQMAYCDLAEFMGLLCHRPENEKQKDS